MELFLKPPLVRFTGPSTSLKPPEKSVLANANCGRGGEAKHTLRAEVKVRIEHFCFKHGPKRTAFLVWYHPNVFLKTILTYVFGMQNYQDALASLADRYLASVPSSKSSDEPTPLPPDQPRRARRTPSKSVVVPRVSPSPKQQVRQVRRHDQGAWVTK